MGLVEDQKLLLRYIQNYMVTDGLDCILAEQQTSTRKLDVTIQFVQIYKDQGVERRCDLEGRHTHQRADNLHLTCHMRQVMYGVDIDQEVQPDESLVQTHRSRCYCEGKEN
ncbi:hypothetical protein KY285_020809 [Solanum tuberosum]|nr:hypothetical protein KY285_020809 [Solanum tuberosum]